MVIKRQQEVGTHLSEALMHTASHPKFKIFPEFVYPEFQRLSCLSASRSWDSLLREQRFSYDEPAASCSLAPVASSACSTRTSDTQGRICTSSHEQFSLQIMVELVIKYSFSIMAGMFFIQVRPLPLKQDNKSSKF